MLTLRELGHLRPETAVVTTSTFLNTGDISENFSFIASETLMSHSTRPKNFPLTIPLTTSFKTIGQVLGKCVR